jgi:hypothetical protein
METTPQTLTDKLLQFQKQITPVKKDGKNPHFGNKYATLSAILSEVKPLLSELGIVLTQPIEENKVQTRLSYKNEVVASEIALPTNLSPQQLGSAITYFRRYTLASLLSLDIEDDDAQSTTEVKKPYLNENSPKFAKAVEFLASGKGTITQIESKYQLSKTVREILLSNAI